MIIGYVNLGGILEAEGRSREVRETYRRGLAMAESMLATSPGSAELRERLANLLYNMGVAMLNEGETVESVRAIRQQAGIFDDLLARKVASTKQHIRNFRDDCATAHYGLGRALQAAGDLRAAADELRRSLALWREIVADFAGAAETYSRLGLAKTQLALADLTDPKEAERLISEGLSMLRDLEPRSPSSQELRSVLDNARQAQAGKRAARSKLHAAFAHINYEGAQ